jgi:hypothetical protein
MSGPEISQLPITKHWSVNCSDGTHILADTEAANHHIERGRTYGVLPRYAMVDYGAAGAAVTRRCAMQDTDEMAITPRGVAVVEAMLGGTRSGAEAADVRFTVIAKHIEGEPLTRDELEQAIRLGVDLNVTDEAVAAFNAI